MHKAYCLCNLVLRNRDALIPAVRELADQGLVPSPLALPFMLVRVSPPLPVASWAACCLLLALAGLPRLGQGRLSLYVGCIALLLCHKLLEL